METTQSWIAHYIRGMYKMALLYAKNAIHNSQGHQCTHVLFVIC